MYTFERGTRTTLRGVNLGVKKIIRAAIPGWEGDRVTVTFLAKVKTAEVDYGRRYNYKYALHKTLLSVSLYSGQVSSYTHGRTALHEEVEADIDVGDACFFKTSAWKKEVMELFINDFTANEHDKELLTIARDAIFDGDLLRAKTIGKEVLPFGWDLFEMLMVRERTIQTTKLREQKV